MVAIDGPAGAGKSTLAQRVADRLGFVYVDTGAMYRAIALWADRTGTAESDMHRMEQLAREATIQFETGSRRILLNGEDISADIRTQSIADAASRIAAQPAVRRALVAKQREICEASSAVMEGRDIGTVVLPEAQVKIYLDADPQVRAGRRVAELKDRGESPDQVETALEMAARDQRDRTRPESPLMQAPDAVYLDTTVMNIEDAEEAVLKLIRERTANGKEVSR